jgi:chemotaxis protein histidine kinase CheA
VPPPHHAYRITYILQTTHRPCTHASPPASMSHSPALPPELSNPSNKNNNAHSNTSPSQLSQILSTVLADYEALSKELAIARARYERAEQTVALLTPLNTSLTATGDSDASSPASTYPDPAVKTIMDLQSYLEAEKAARKAVDSRLRTVSEAWSDLDRYLQASEVHLSDARSRFSQVLRDPSAEPSFKPLPPYQPPCSHLSASRAPIAKAQTLPPFPRPPAPISPHQSDRKLRGTKSWRH